MSAMGGRDNICNKIAQFLLDTVIYGDSRLIFFSTFIFQIYYIFFFQKSLCTIDFKILNILSMIYGFSRIILEYKIRRSKQIIENEYKQNVENTKKIVCNFGYHFCMDEHVGMF